MIKNLITGFIVLVLFSGCLKNNEDCNYDPCGIKAPANEIQSVRDYLSAQGITNAIEHCSGLFYVIDNAGSGKKPDGCSSVNAGYKGSLTNGTIFDQNAGLSISLTSVITGWKSGIPLIKEGGKIRLYIPPTLGYGNRQTGNIPPNSILIFEVDLNAVQ